jgi:hypothetical protein
MEAPTVECPAEVQIALERRGRVAEHAEKVRHDAEPGLHVVEEALGLVGRFRGVNLSDAVHFPSRLKLSCVRALFEQRCGVLITLRAKRDIPVIVLKQRSLPQSVAESFDYELS